MEIKSTKRREDLPLLAIESAEELQRLKLKKITDLKYTGELFQLIKKDFPTRLDYSTIFSNAYFATYSSEIPSTLGERIPYIEEIYKKLESPSSLKNKDLSRLINFCANLSDYSAMYEEDINNLKTSRYGRF